MLSYVISFWVLEHVHLSIYIYDYIELYQYIHSFIYPSSMTHSFIQKMWPECLLGDLGVGNNEIMKQVFCPELMGLIFKRGT